ncbi:hypothetical protein IQ255_07250 [Pleurocapsales cyanobacterium LEGE 10410]|nr:hypothetical protein [Pleurocapsales cyanobacterium LEGE 10410]
MTNSSQTSPLSFNQAIAATQSLMNEINTNKLSEDEIEQRISSILTSKDSARGFFATYLTSNMSLADYPSSGVINGLKSSAKVVSQLLVKNLAMSSAMVVTHIRNSDQSNVEGSQKVCRRTSDLIQKINLESVKNELQKLQNTIITEKGFYQDFLERWGYDAEQRTAIQKAIVNTLI